MYMHDTMLDCSKKQNLQKAIESIEMLDTIGDRVDWLLKSTGRDDRGNDYEQKELAAWLTGEDVARNGKRYNLSFGRGMVSRMVTNQIKLFSPDLINALCEIFDTDAEWLLRCNTLTAPEPKQHDIFTAPETGEVALLVDRMDPSNRQFMLAVARHIARKDSETKMLDTELADIVTKYINLLQNGDRERAKLIIAQIRRSQMPGSETWPN